MIIKRINNITIEQLPDFSISGHYVLKASRRDKHGYNVSIERRFDHRPTMHDTLDFILHISHRFGVKLPHKLSGKGQCSKYKGQSSKFKVQRIKENNTLTH